MFYFAFRRETLVNFQLGEGWEGGSAGVAVAGGGHPAGPTGKISWGNLLPVFHLGLGGGDFLAFGKPQKIDGK